jgi:very-short-patch-repair endonuclease
MGYTFNRQKPIGNYIVDFYCKPLNLVIEVDGGYHFEEEQQRRDMERQQILEDMRLHFLRFRDEDVRKDMNSVKETIVRFIEGRAGG